MGPVGVPSIPGQSGNVAGSPRGSSLPESRPLLEVWSGTAAWSSDSTLLWCFLLPVPHVEEQMGHLYFGNVKSLFGMAFPGFQSSFDGSAGFWWIGIRRIPVVGKIDSRYVWLEQGPFGNDWRDSVRKAGGAYSLTDILLAGGQMKLLHFAGSPIQQTQFRDHQSFCRPAPYRTALLECSEGR